MASDKDIARTEEYSDSEDEAEEGGERRHANSHKEDEPTAKRPKVAEKTGEGDDGKVKTEAKPSSAPTSKTSSPKPAGSPKVADPKSPEKPSNLEQNNDPNGEKWVLAYFSTLASSSEMVAKLSRQNYDTQLLRG